MKIFQSCHGDFFLNKNILKHFFFSWKQIPFFFFPLYMQLSATAQWIKYSAFKKQMFRVEILRLNPKLIKRHPELTWGYPCSHLVPTSEGLPRIHEIFLKVFGLGLITNEFFSRRFELAAEALRNLHIKNQSWKPHLLKGYKEHKNQIVQLGN